VEEDCDKRRGSRKQSVLINITARMENEDGRKLKVEID
jgi:hypothetical protein